MEIKVGIFTEGKPVARPDGNGNTVLENQAIGVGFHWMKTCVTLLPGKVTLLPEMREISDGNTDRCGISLINTLDLETYLKSVISSEMNPRAPREFLKAHAVIARSWAIGKILDTHRHDPTGKRKVDNTVIDWADTDSHHGFHVCSDDHCQRYQGIGNLTPSVEAAVESTRGMYLADSGNMPADTRFSKCCGGKTELYSTCWQDTDYPYLQSVDDPYCDLSDMDEDSRNKFLDCVLKDYDRNLGTLHDWEVTTSTFRVAYNLKSMLGIDIGEISDLIPLRKGASGRISLMEIIGKKGKITVGKELLIRRLFCTSTLYSSAFSIRNENGLLTLTGKGWGHGVGLCQIGAARMATLGFDFKKILEHYYPATYLRTQRD